MIQYNEDFKKGEVVLSQGRRLSVQDMGVLAAVGCADVAVTSRPKIGYCRPETNLCRSQKSPDRPGPGRQHVRDRCVRPRPRLHPGLVRDRQGRPGHFGAAFAHAAGECDAVLISGGSSKDDRDIAAAVIAERGEVLIHGVAIAPGKPTIIGGAAPSRSSASPATRLKPSSFLLPSSGPA